MSLWQALTRQFSSQEKETDWEALLIEADFGVDLAVAWSEEMSRAGQNRSPERAEAWLRKKMSELLSSPSLKFQNRPEVILLVGVNGSGKTTTTGKLAHYWQRQGYVVHLAAADTYRAAAAEQLQVWGDRTGSFVTRAGSQADPASVAVSAWLKAEKEKADFLLVDTAGRQANRHNLLLELGKIKRSLQKKNPQIPHHTWLVVDGTSGRAVLDQAREFHQAVGLTGVIVTKLDGSARGGMIVALKQLFQLQTYFLGRGEGAGDLEEFQAENYVQDFFAP